MENDTTYNIYPGDYVPMFKPEEFEEVLKLRCKREMHLPPVNISKSSGSFIVEIAIPGLRKRDFLLHAIGNILHLKVLHRDNEPKEARYFLQHEFDYACLEQSITLPDNVYSEFLIAEYKEGILRIIMPETNSPVENRYSRLAVY